MPWKSWCLKKFANSRGIKNLVYCIFFIVDVMFVSGSGEWKVKLWSHLNYAQLYYISTRNSISISAASSQTLWPKTATIHCSDFLYQNLRRLTGTMGCSQGLQSGAGWNGNSRQLVRPSWASLSFRTLLCLGRVWAPHSMLCSRPLDCLLDH